MQKKTIILFSLFWSVTITSFAAPLFDPSFAKNLSVFLQKENAEKVEVLSPQEGKSFQFLQENKVLCNVCNQESLLKGWFFSLDIKPLSEKTKSLLIKSLYQDSLEGLVLNPLSPIAELAEKHGYIRDEEASNKLLQSIAIFRKPQIGHFEKALKKIDHKTVSSPIKLIDFIYLINLDSRPEKWKKSLVELSPYKIEPHRFSAIHGWSLSPKIINSIILRPKPGMTGGRWVSHFPAHLPTLIPEHDFLIENNEEDFGKPCVLSWMSPGALGCTLSHLSVIQDAYTSGYETIWVMEDDISVQKDPHLLTQLIEKLDHLVGKEGWDILYTDTDAPDEGEGNRDRHDLVPNLWRPDANPSTLAMITKRETLSEDFVKIHSRAKTHSMIVRRSGMKKILDFAKNNRIFLPYDDELAFVPDIKLFNLRSHYITCAKENVVSDTEKNIFAEIPLWSKCKEKILEKVSETTGWQNPFLSEKVIDFIYKKKPKLCVEIGAFGGMISYQIAQTLQFLHQGTLHAIDSWDQKLATEGILEENVVQFWKNIDMEAIYQGFQTMIAERNLADYCQTIRQDSRKAVSSFEDESIDFLYIDGNGSTAGCLEDVKLYFPKVKEGGYIWMADPRLIRKYLAVQFLMNHCTWLKEDSADTLGIVFQKKPTSK